jgi:hypothetical protein
MLKAVGMALSLTHLHPGTERLGTREKTRRGGQPFLFVFFHALRQGEQLAVEKIR